MVSYSVNFNGNVINFAISDEDAGRIITAFTAIMTRPSQNGVPVVPTESEVIQAVARQSVSQLISIAQRYEQQVAAKAAAAQIQPITITPAT